MSASRWVAFVCLLCGLLGGCATGYQKQGWTGGFSELHLQDDVWRVRYGGNGYTTYETVQTYWLNHCAELALQNGFDGFEILSDVRFAARLEWQLEASDTPRLLPAHTTYVPIVVPGGGYAYSPHPQMIGDIRLLHGEIKNAPPKVFDARALKRRLDDLINGKKCDNGNVCPHVHDYVYGPANKDA